MEKQLEIRCSSNDNENTPKTARTTVSSLFCSIAEEIHFSKEHFSTFCSSRRRLTPIDLIEIDVCPEVNLENNFHR